MEEIKVKYPLASNLLQDEGMAAVQNLICGNLCSHINSSRFPPPGVKLIPASWYIKVRISLSLSPPFTPPLAYPR